MAFSQEARDALLGVIRGDLSRFEQTRDPLCARTAYHNCGGDSQLLNYLRDYFEVGHTDLHLLDFSVVEDKSCLSLNRMYSFENDGRYSLFALYDMVMMSLRSPRIKIPESHKETFETLFDKILRASDENDDSTMRGLLEEWYDTVKSLGYGDVLFVVDLNFPDIRLPKELS
ncbi:MAG: hypothetical protein AAGM67_01815 [Bacteroidota bacterium]